METKNVNIENLSVGNPKNPENYYLEIELEDKGQDFLKLQIDKFGYVVGAQPFFSAFCNGLKIEINSILLNWYPDYKWKEKNGQLKYKIIDYIFLMPKSNDFLYKGSSAFIGSFERFQDIGICEDSKLNMDINNVQQVQNFCVNEADTWFDGFEDDSKENRLLFAKLLFDKLNQKFK